MGREERVMRILEVLVDSGCALPAVAIFRNAKLRGADFERRVVDSYLKELHEDGYVMKVKADPLDGGEVVEIPLQDEGWFMATDAGYRHLSED
jgi:repressor of nif and glnA expression